jgi:alanine dehydrogenase
MEPDFGKIVIIPDADYTEVGASTVSSKVLLIQESSVIVKFSPLTYEELYLLRDKQIVIAPFDAETLTKEMILLMESKKITAAALNFLQIENEKLEPFMPSKIAAMVNAFFSTNINFAVISSALLLQSIYCYKGILCKKEISEIVALPWKNIFRLF